jgi:acetyl-CoA carboxylase carboxyltransferase component
MWPNARISVMGGEQAASVLVQVKVKKLQEKGVKMSEAERAAMMKPIVDTYEAQASPYYSTSRLWDDGILDPLDTRAALGLGIAMSLNAPIPDYKVGIFRM